MKILVVSDTHGRQGNFDKMLKKEGQPDMLIHLGDVEESEDYIRAVMECPVYMVAGNNDYWTGLPRETEVRIAGQKVMLTHGHAYYVSMGTDRLALAASSRGAQAVFYGHTHRPVVEWNHGILVANPGSLSYPRQSDRRPSYIVIEAEKDSMLRPEIRYLWKGSPSYQRRISAEKVSPDRYRQSAQELLADCLRAGKTALK